ncbi:MAG: tyrosine-type recombinase/integrase [Tetragenococcus sp.]|nr:tyrosine-type recombinase/integrase [Tetragenococcus sp.]
MWMEELPNGKFTYRERYKDPYTEKNKKVSVTLNSKSNQAKNKAQRMLNEKIEKTLDDKKKTGIRFSEAFSAWEKYYPQTVKERTYVSYKYPIKIIRNYFDDNIIIDNLRQKDIKNFLEHQYYKNNYSLNYVNQMRNILVSVFDYTELQVNPARNIALKRKPATLEEVQKVEQKYLEHEEAEKIIDYQTNALYSRRFAQLTEFMLLTGMRFGEAAALQYKDFDGQSIYITKTLDYVSHKTSEGFNTTPKNRKAQRKVGLSDRAIEILKEVINDNHFRALTQDYEDKDFVFTTRTGNPIHITNYNTSLQNAANRKGIKKDVSSHILRHTHISTLAEMGLHLKAIMDRVGHGDSKTTQTIYMHVTDKMQQEVVDRLNNFVPYSCPKNKNKAKTEHSNIDK